MHGFNRSLVWAYLFAAFPVVGCAEASGDSANKVDHPDEAIASPEVSAPTPQQRVEATEALQAWMARVVEQSMRSDVLFSEQRATPQEIGWLIASGADVSTVDEAGNTPLHVASRYLRRTQATLAVSILLEAGSEVDARNHAGMTPLRMAAWNREVIPLLLTAGAEVDAAADDGSTPLHRAAGSGSNAHLCAALLIEVGADVNRAADDGTTPIHHAWNPQALDVLIKAGADVHARDNEGRTPLHTNGRNGHEGVALLLQAGADGKAVDHSGEVVLHTHASNPESVRLLLQAGADAKAADQTGRTVLHQAAGNADSVRLLLAAGADAFVVDHSGRSVLVDALRRTYREDNGNRETIGLLLAAGADPKAIDDTGRTLLHHAARSRNAQAVELLLQAGLDPNAPNQYGDSTLDSAFVGGGVSVVIIRLLMEAGAEMGDGRVAGVLFHAVDAGDLELAAEMLVQYGDINKKLRRGQTLLHRAVTSYEPEFVAFLIKAGADVDAVDDRGRTPLHADAYYRPRKPVEIVSLLVSAGANVAIQDDEGKTASQLMRERGRDDAAAIIESALGIE